MTGDTLVQSHAMAKSLSKRFAEEAAAPSASNLEAVPLSGPEADEVLCCQLIQRYQRDGEYK